MDKYESIFLVRNEQDVCIYDFKDGRRFEPDFLLFLKRKNDTDTYDNIQLFIEPKGIHLKLKDQWKEEFLVEIRQRASIHFSLQSETFNVWGLPFYNQSEESFFENEFAQWL